MCRHLHTFLLILAMLGVAVAPLRGAWASPDAGTPDTVSHCAGMQHAMQRMHQHAGHDSIAIGKPHKCKSGCNGTCCDRNCAVCLHPATTAISAGVPILRAAPASIYGMSASGSFPERPPTPPLRPPLACHS
jgi:hypothetical protein